MKDYAQFLKTKTFSPLLAGITPKETHPSCFPHQRDLIKWGVWLGRAAIWADCGLGKTRMQLLWCDQLPDKKIIVAPLNVVHQTIKEAKEIGIKVRFARNQDEVKGAITITNYQMLKNFDASKFSAVALDESSILKSLDGSYRTMLIEMFRNTRFRSCWTATPAPNDHMEIGNHAEFLGVMTRAEMLSMFFVQDAGETQKWRLKGHAREEFWKWVSSWAVMIRKPSDLGYSDEGFILPKLHVHTIIADHVHEKKRMGLLPFEAKTMQERLSVRRASVETRVKEAAKLCNSDPGAWVVWCNLNKESDLSEKKIEGARQVKGEDQKIEERLKILNDFCAEKFPLVTKGKITGFGSNWQHCHRMIFVGLNDSWEQFYQCIRRCWRFGQKEEVHVYVIIARGEGAVLKNIMRKEAEAEEMMTQMVKHMKNWSIKNIRGSDQNRMAYEPNSSMMLLQPWLKTKSE
jgi:hypothetical protein